MTYTVCVVQNKKSNIVIASFNTGIDITKKTFTFNEKEYEILEVSPTSFKVKAVEAI